MNVKQLVKQYYNLVSDCEEYYNNFTSQQEEDIILDPEEQEVYLDYLHPEKGVYIDVKVLKLKKSSLLVVDMTNNKSKHILFSDLTLQDQIEILEIYEQNQ